MEGSAGWRGDLYLARDLELGISTGYGKDFLLRKNVRQGFFGFWSILLFRR